MYPWTPISIEELQSLIHEQLADCTPEQLGLFAKVCIPPRSVPIERYGRLKSVFVVAEFGDEVMYYEDVEEGFSVSTLGPDGRIAEHLCNQDDLKHVLYRWQRNKTGYRTTPSNDSSHP